jgi:hypothetical protein
LKACQSDKPGSFDRGLCFGYVQGVSDAIDHVRHYYELTQCPRGTTGITARQVKDVVVKYLMAHPEQRRVQAASLAFNAMVEAWNCDGLPVEAWRRLDPDH